MKAKHLYWMGFSMIFLCLCHAEAVEKRTVVAVIGADGVQRVEMTAGSYFFDPNYIVVAVNVPVQITVKKEPGMIPHDIVMKAPDAGIDFSLELKDSPQTIRFTPTRTGMFPFYCKKKMLFLESHREKGMEGTLEVREK